MSWPPFAEITAEQRKSLLANSMQLVRITAFTMARRLPRHIDVDDLISAGYVALVEALVTETNDEHHFECYLAVRVRGAMLDELRRLDMLSRDERDFARRVDAAEASLTAELHAPPDDTALAERLSEHLDAVRSSRAVSSARAMVRFDNIAVADVAHSSGESDLLPHQLERALAALSPRAAAFVRMRYLEELSYLEIAIRMRLTESRACQLDEEILVRLRKKLRVETPPVQSRWPEPSRREAARKLRDEGLTLSAIADILGISPSTVCRITRVDAGSEVFA